MNIFMYTPKVIFKNTFKDKTVIKEKKENVIEREKKNILLLFY